MIRLFFTSIQVELSHLNGVNVNFIKDWFWIRNIVVVLIFDHRRLIFFKHFEFQRFLFWTDRWFNFKMAIRSKRLHWAFKIADIHLFIFFLTFLLDHWTEPWIQIDFGLTLTAHIFDFFQFALFYLMLFQLYLDERRILVRWYALLNVWKPGLYRLSSNLAELILINIHLCILIFFL